MGAIAIFLTARRCAKVRLQRRERSHAKRIEKSLPAHSVGEPRQGFFQPFDLLLKAPGYKLRAYPLAQVLTSVLDGLPGRGAILTYLDAPLVQDRGDRLCGCIPLHLRRPGEDLEIRAGRADHAPFGPGFGVAVGGWSWLKERRGRLAFLEVTQSFGKSPKWLSQIRSAESVAKSKDSEAGHVDPGRFIALVSL
jgi:hypothetical protein